MDYSYDTASRLLSFDNSMNSGHHLYEYTPDHVEGRLYDKVGNRTTMSVTDGGGTEMHVYSYDRFYQVTGVDYPAGYDPGLATDTAFHYDDAGNRTAVIDSGGTSSYVTNALNQYTAVGGVAYTYDNSGNMTYDGANMYAYDPENRLTTVEKVPESLAAACDIALAFPCGGDADWFSQSSEYNYDADAAQSGDIDDDESTWLETTVTGSGTLYFDYKVSCASGDEFAFYIDDQYRFGRSGVTSWNESGPWTISGAGPHTIRWKYTKDAGGSGGSDCVWVDHVRWSDAMPSTGSWSTIAYTYDPSGRRIEKKVDGNVEVKYVYDGSHIVAEYNNTGTLLRKYVHGSGIDQPICMIEASGTYAGTHYYHYDALGSVVAMTSSSGNVVQLYEYSIYGQVAASDENHPNRFMFTGREFDKDTGLYYYRARHYNPEIGRFLQANPVGYSAGTHLYRYCNNRPLALTDPSGCYATSFLNNEPTKPNMFEHPDQAAMAAAAIMQKNYDANPDAYATNREQFCWIYEYNNFVTADWEPGDPCMLYGFTEPVWEEKTTRQVLPSTVKAQEAEIPSNSHIVGDVHSHGENGGLGFSTPATNGIGQGCDTGAAEMTAVERGVSCYRAYVLGDMDGKQALLAYDVLVGCYSLEDMYYLASAGPERTVAGYDPENPPSPWVRPVPVGP